MMHQSFPLSINKLYENDEYFNNALKSRKRRVSFTTVVDFNETPKTSNKKRKTDISLPKDKSSALDVLDISINDSDNDFFEWMESTLDDDVDSNILSSEDSVTSSEAISDCGDANIDPLPTLEDPDPRCEDVVSFLEQGESETDGSDENIFRKIQDSFVSDRLLEQLYHPSSPPASPKSVTMTASPSFNTLRKGIHKGLHKLARANKRTSRTRSMLLHCKENILPAPILC